MSLQAGLVTAYRPWCSPVQFHWTWILENTQCPCWIKTRLLCNHLERDRTWILSTHKLPKSPLYWQRWNCSFFTDYNSGFSLILPLREDLLRYPIIELSLFSDNVWCRANTYFLKLSIKSCNTNLISTINLLKYHLTEISCSSSWCIFSLATISNKFNLFNNKYIPGLLWLENIAPSKLIQKAEILLPIVKIIWILSSYTFLWNFSIILLFLANMLQILVQNPTSERG